MLPRMMYADGIRGKTTSEFKGLNHTRGAEDGEVYWMENLSSDHAPVISPREPRKNTGLEADYIWSNGALYHARSGVIYREGIQKATYTGTIKDVAALGFVTAILMADATLYIYDNAQTIKSAGASVAGLTVEVGDGEETELSTITTTGQVDFTTLFKTGDGLTIAGAGENDSTIIVRAVEAKKLTFYENSFREEGTFTNVTISRDVPEMDFICANENRLWGCKGDTIYASKMGDPYNFNVFDGLADDSWAVQAGSGGSFTGCCSYLGYPVFFKEENIYKVYGDVASNFRLMGSANLGVMEGAEKSLAIAGETLFYLSRAGVMAYAGGMPASISLPLGDMRFSEGVGGSDGLKYYISVKDESGQYHIFVFDTRRKLWHREDGYRVKGWAWSSGLYMVRETTRDNVTKNELVLEVGDCDWVTCQGETVSAEVIFADFTDDSPYQKGIAKVLLRIELEANATLGVAIRYDSRTQWETVKTINQAVAKRSFYLPVIPHRCDHFSIKVSGTGKWYLYSVTRELYSGTALH